MYCINKNDLEDKSTYPSVTSRLILWIIIFDQIYIYIDRIYLPFDKSTYPLMITRLILWTIILTKYIGLIYLPFDKSTYPLDMI